MKPKVTVSWGLVGDEMFDPELLSSELQLTPTIAYRKGEIRAFPLAPPTAPQHTRKHSVWVLELSDHTYDAASLLKRLLEIAHPKREIARRHVAQSGIFEVTVGVHAQVYDEDPDVSIDPSTLLMISELGATLLVAFDYVDGPWNDSPGQQT